MHTQRRKVTKSKTTFIQSFATGVLKGLISGFGDFGKCLQELETNKQGAEIWHEANKAKNFNNAINNNEIKTEGMSSGEKIISLSNKLDNVIERVCEFRSFIGKMLRSSLDKVKGKIVKSSTKKLSEKGKGNDTTPSNDLIEKNVSEEFTSEDQKELDKLENENEEEEVNPLLEKDSKEGKKFSFRKSG